MKIVNHQSEGQQTTQQEGLLGQPNKNSQKAAKTPFFEKFRNTVLVFTVIVAGASAAFILVNVFLFSYEAFQFGQIENIELEVFYGLLILTCKFLMLIMFTCALVMGSLIPLALMYIILLPIKQKNS